MNYRKAYFILFDTNNVREKTIKEIKKQYRKKALQLHPDKKDVSNINENHSFIELHEAYQYLIEYNSNEKSEINISQYRIIIDYFLQNKKTIHQIIGFIHSNEYLQNLLIQNDEILYYFLYLIKNSQMISDEDYETIERVIIRFVNKRKIIKIDALLEHALNKELYIYNKHIYIPLWMDEYDYNNIHYCIDLSSNNENIEYIKKYKCVFVRLNEEETKELLEFEKREENLELHELCLYENRYEYRKKDIKGWGRHIRKQGIGLDIECNNFGDILLFLYNFDKNRI